MKVRRILEIIVCFLFACLIAFGVPLLAEDKGNIEINQTVLSAVEQKVTEYSSEKLSYNKLYNNGQLVGVITNLDDFYNYIDSEYENYEAKFPNTTLGLCDDLYIVKEDTFNIFENKDKEIVEYLVQNDLLGVKTNAIEFSTKDGVFDIIYVNDLEDFYTARDQFLLNFVSEDTLAALSNNKKIEEPSDFGTVEIGLKIAETITFTSAFMPPDEIFTDVNEIYNYLCYGRNSERQYYETVEGDTLQGVGYRFQNMSPKQLMMLNPGVISSEDQVITAGLKLNVTYFSSPLTVIVSKNRLAQEVINPDNPEYKTDPTLEENVTRVEVEEVNGLENVLYEETWVNGVLQSGNKKSSVIVRAPIQAVIVVGTQKTVDYGTGNYVWPVDNAKITCGWGCYYGHTGTDFVNQYERYGPIHAADTGVIYKAAYNGIDGNFVEIDHQNGVITHYGHMSAIFVEVGQTVHRGDIIGQIGMTGVATGPHCHFHFLIDGVIQNACNYMDCTSIPWS